MSASNITCETGTIAIGLEALQCSFIPQLRKPFPGIENCSESEICECFANAMENYPESSIDIILASISLLAKNASSLDQLNQSIARIERIVDVQLTH